MDDDLKPLPTIVYVSDEEFDHVVEILTNPDGSSLANLRGAEFLRRHRELTEEAKRAKRH